LETETEFSSPEDHYDLLLQEILENPLQYASEHIMPFLSDSTTWKDTEIAAGDVNATTSGDDHHDHHDMNHNRFCSPTMMMMTMDENSRRLHGVESMPPMVGGGDMSMGMIM
jgi:hypothetical protein